MLDLGDDPRITGITIRGGTVGWTVPDEPRHRLRFDVAERQLKGRCRAHTGYRVLRSNAQVVLSRRVVNSVDLSIDEDGYPDELVRLCRRSTGRDRLVLDSADVGGWDLDATAVGGRFAAVANSAVTKYGDHFAFVDLFDAASGRERQIRISAVQAGLGADVPVAVAGLAVGGDGAVAWVARDDVSSALYVIPRGREQRRVAEAGGPSRRLDALTIDSGQLHWRLDDAAYQTEVIAPGFPCAPPLGYMVTTADDDAVLARLPNNTASPPAWSCLRATGQSTMFPMQGVGEQLVGHFAASVDPDGFVFKRYDLVTGQHIGEDIPSTDCVLAAGAAMACATTDGPSTDVIAADGTGTHPVAHSVANFWIDGQDVHWKNPDGTTGSAALVPLA